MAQQILTVPETLKDKTKYYPVGNEWIALPELNELGQVESFNIISELHKGMIEFRGAPQQPILAPFQLWMEGSRSSPISSGPGW